MKNGITEVVFVIDKSGSMSGYELDTVGGFNATVREHKEKEGKCFVTTVLFNSSYQMLHDRVPIEEIGELTRSDYRVGGCTALYDALGEAITHVSKIHKYARAEDVPEHTIFVITTDGMENASSRYDGRQIRSLIKSKTEECGWEFVFLAANIDVESAANDIGIRRDRAVRFRQDREGITDCYVTLSRAINAVRAGKRLEDDDWRREIDGKNGEKGRGRRKK